ncbi:hypothetical protein EMGBD4_04860 [Verrucomicrobiota bacterium]|nr:hypothetical protein EMGBD4_04860 [Verrucomicrobiota bacterium]
MQQEGVDGVLAAGGAPEDPDASEIQGRFAFGEFGQPTNAIREARIPQVAPCLWWNSLPRFQVPRPSICTT